MMPVGKVLCYFIILLPCLHEAHLHFYCTALHFANCGMHLPQLNVTRVNTSCVVPAFYSSLASEKQNNRTYANMARAAEY